MEATELQEVKEHLTAEQVYRQEVQTELVCKPGDKECLSRWIAAFSDCE